jgi:sulfate adenylyltransferase subunit 2
MRSLKGALTLRLEGRGEMKRNLGPKKESTRFAIHSRIDKGESIRVFPLSNWTELDIWLYIQAENIPIVPLYFAKEREVVLRSGSLVLIHDSGELLPGEKTRTLKCRMRSLGCIPCTGAIRSDADSVAGIIEEMVSFRRSERENRAIDHDEEGSMELKKREGYF